MINRSNNHIMHICERDIHNDEPRALEEVKQFIASYYKYNGVEFEENFSHDNWKLVVCWLYYFYGETKAHPLWGRHSWRIYDNFVFFLFARAPKTFFFLRPIISFWLLLGVFDIWEMNRHGVKYIDTDGDRIAFYITEVYEMNWTRWIMDQFIKRTVLKSWGRIFTIYGYHEDPETLDAIHKRFVRDLIE